MNFTRDFNGLHYHSFCQQQYDAARHFLKNCGKPIDEYDRWLIDFHKATISIFGFALDRTKIIKNLK